MCIYVLSFTHRIFHASYPILGSATLEQNNLIVTKADKGNTLLIVQQDEYNKKVDEFITQNNFTRVANNRTNKQQKAIKTVINACNKTNR
jgi:hypothetical protein